MGIWCFPRKYILVLGAIIFAPGERKPAGLTPDVIISFTVFWYQKTVIVWPGCRAADQADGQSLLLYDKVSG